MPYLFAAAVLGLAAGVAVNVGSYFGLTFADLRWSAALLHFGMFAVFIPALGAGGRPAEASRGAVPRWAWVGVGAAFLFAFANGWASLYLLMRSDGFASGGGLEHRPAFARGFSGVWMFFYAASAAMLYGKVGRMPPVAAARTWAARLRPTRGLHVALTWAAIGAAVLGLPWAAVTGYMAAVGLREGEPLPADPAVAVAAVAGLVACMFGSAALGLFAAGRAVKRCVPARCPACAGPAYHEFGRSVPTRGGGGRAVDYRCRSCGHVHPTGLIESGLFVPRRAGGQACEDAYCPIFSIRS